MLRFVNRVAKTARKFTPSTNQVLLIAVISLYLYCLLEGDRLPYFFFRGIALVFVGAWIWSAKIYSGISYSTAMEAERSQVGQTFPLYVTLANSLMFYMPWLEVNIDIPPEFQLVYGRKGQVLSLSRRETRTFTYQVQCLKRGYYQVGAATVRLGDVFGIFVRERLLRADRTLIVYPRIIALEKLNIPSLINLGSAATLRTSNEDLTGPTGVRKYAKGDPLNRINWRATARIGQLQVKEYDLHTAPELGIFLDLTTKAYQNIPDHVLETAVTTAASIANFCYNKRLRYGLVSSGVSLFVQPSSRDVSQLLKTMEHLAVADAGGGYSFARTVLLESRNFIKGTTLLFITPRIDEELVGILGALRKRGYCLAIVQVGESNGIPEFGYSVTYFEGLTSENLAQTLGGEGSAARYRPWVG
ncbi:MAG TPA: DUF58 domain-containing protein [Candidatus Deferrimicrobium sp.]|nr:DUF58 domain-containing protein [Candidatus Deferrimicrobium sp.]